MKEVMLYLAENWVIGYSILASVAVIIYLVFSILLVRSARKVNMDIGISGMIPIYNLIIWVKKKIHIRRYSRPIKATDEITL